MPTEDITRTEYEQFIKTYEIRHAELRLEMKEVETEIKSDILSMSTKIDALSLQMARRGMDAWKLLSVSAFSVIGGYIVSYLQHVFIK